MKKNTVNAILENLSRLNEVKSINLGSGKSAYQSNGKYYIKSGDTKKEISADQYQKLLNKNNSTKSDAYKTDSISTELSEIGMDYEESLSVKEDTDEEFSVASDILGCNKEDILVVGEDFFDEDGPGSSDNEFSNILNSLKINDDPVGPSDYGLTYHQGSHNGTKFVIKNEFGYRSLFFQNPNS